MSNTRTPYTFDRVARIIVTVVSIIGVFYLLNLLKGALLPFLVAMLLAYILNPIVDFFQHKLKFKNRVLAIFATLISICLVLTAMGFILIPSIIKQVDEAAHAIQNLPNLGNGAAAIVDSNWYESIFNRLNIKELAKAIQPEEWKNIAQTALTNIWSLLTGSIHQVITLISWLIVILYLVFILIDYNKITTGFKSLIPEKYRDITLSIVYDVEEGMNRYFRGQSFIAFCVGILFSIGFVIIGLPLAIPLGLFIGVLNLVPYLQTVGVIPTILLCWLGATTHGTSFWALFAASMVVFAVVQSIQDIFLTPKIMGKVTGLNPAVILLSLSVWGSLMGMMGMIIALPLTTILLSYYKRYILKEK